MGDVAGEYKRIQDLLPLGKMLIFGELGTSEFCLEFKALSGGLNL